jgi:hypothetical protein
MFTYYAAVDARTVAPLSAHEADQFSGGLRAFVQKR